MEQYLIDQYGVIEDERYLKSTDDIEDFASDSLHDLFDCGQGYYSDEAKVILKIGEKFYSVKVYANITSAKQEYGERLYWVDSIDKVEYKEIEKPMPMKVDEDKEIKKYGIKLKGCDDENYFNMGLTQTEYELILRIAEKSKEESRYNCMPVLIVGEPFEEEGEDDE